MFFSSETDGVVFGPRSYSGSKRDVWGSQFNMLINGHWFGDERVNFRITLFCLNPNRYFTITSNNETLQTELNK